MASSAMQTFANPRRAKPHDARQSPKPKCGFLLPQITHARNPGMALDLDWVASVQANTSAIERRAATLAGSPLGEEGLPGRLAV